MSPHGTVQLCASNKLSFQSRPFSAQKISLSVEQSSFTAICLPLWMIIRAELAWWPLPCVWLYQEDKFMLWKSLESALESVYAHPPSQTMRNSLSATSSPWGESKTSLIQRYWGGEHAFASDIHQNSPLTLTGFSGLGDLWYLSDPRLLMFLVPVKYSLPRGTWTSLQLVLRAIMTDKVAFEWLHMCIHGVLLLPNSTGKKCMLDSMT